MGVCNVEIKSVMNDAKNIFEDYGIFIAIGAVVLFVVMLITKNNGSDTTFVSPTSYASYPDASENANVIIDSINKTIEYEHDETEELIKSNFKTNEEYIEAGLNAQNAMLQMNYNSVMGTLGYMQESSDNSFRNLENNIANVNNNVTSSFNSITSGIENLRQQSANDNAEMRALWSEAHNQLETVNKNLIAGFDNVNNGIESVNKNLIVGFDNMNNGINSVNRGIASIQKDVADATKANVNAMNTLTNAVNASGQKAVGVATTTNSTSAISNTSTAKSSTAKSSTAKSSTAKSSTAKSSTAKSSTAKSSTANSGNATKSTSATSAIKKAIGTGSSIGSGVFSLLK